MADFTCVPPVKELHVQQTVNTMHIKEEPTGDTGWQQDEQEQEMYSEDQETYDYFGSTQRMAHPTKESYNNLEDTNNYFTILPSGHRLYKTYKILKQTTKIEQQLNKEKDVPNDSIQGTAHPTKQSYNSLKDTNEYFTVLPSGHRLYKTYKILTQTTSTGLKQNEEKDAPNEEMSNVRSEMEEANCELSNEELCVGHPGKEMEHPGKGTRHPGKEMEHPGKELEHPGKELEHPGKEMGHPGREMGHPGNEMHHNEQPGKESNSRETKTTVMSMGLQQEKCDVKFPQLDTKSTSQEQGAPFMCGECGHTANYRFLIIRHMKTHTREPYMCGECGYRTPKKSHFSRHMRTHTGERPFKCDQCDYTAAEKYSLDIHLTTHDKRDKPYMCGECGFRTTRKPLLSSHMKTHIGQKPYKCDQCDYSAARKSDLSTHLIKHNRSYTCGECGFKASQRCLLSKHMRFHVGEHAYADTQKSTS
ncbi:uncharacterized protein LOC144864822 [Branchiostoma floridae x Branchiostoma japonicum]